MPVCLLCDEELIELPERGGNRYSHPETETCLVRVTDEYGIAVTDDEPSQELTPTVEADEGDDEIRQFPLVETVLKEIFASFDLHRLGGASTGRGWTSFSNFQRCQYLWRRLYLEPLPKDGLFASIEHPARAIGTLVHTFLAIYYRRMFEPDYPLTPELVKELLLAKANPDFIYESWRVFVSYVLYYQLEEIMPLAVELDLKDPRNNESCRFDLVAFFPKSVSDRPAGTYIVEHKTSDRFDDVTLNGWANDGEVLGQMMLWDRLKLDLRYGQLKGVIVNILGKQKDPQMHRTWVPPSAWQFHQHREDLKRHEARIHLAIAENSFPRSRANCIGRFGKCQLFDWCATESAGE